MAQQDIESMPPPSPQRRYTLARLFRLFQKELKETIRDRRTIMTLVLMPLLVYPILSMALNRFLLSSKSVAEGFTVAVGSDEEAMQLDRWLNDPRSAPPEAILRSSGENLAKFLVTVVKPRTAEQAVAENQVDIGLVIERIGSRTPVVKAIAFRGDGTSQAARRVFVERLHWLKLAEAQTVIRQALPGYPPPVIVQVEDVGEAKKGDMLATIVPLVLVLMTITGAVYPAIDLTAGERERGTMESVMASPVPRSLVLVAKYLAVVVVALFTALANLIGMFTTLWASGLLGMLTSDNTVPWMNLLRILGLLVLFSGFYSALLLCLTSFARSFKEAQAYLIPVMLLSLTPAMLSLMPGASLSGAMAVVPLVNIVLLARDLLAGSVDPLGALMAVTSTLVYAVAALTVATRLFGADAVTRTSEKSIGSLFRRPKNATSFPSPQASALMLAILVPVYFVVSNGLMRLLQSRGESISVNVQLLFNAGALIATFGLVPLLAAFLERNRLVSAFRLHRAPIACYVGAVLLGLGAWALAHEAFVIADAMGIGGLGEDQIRGAQQMIEKMRQSSPLLLLAVFALTPAVIEEWCFRGYLFSSLRQVLTPGRTIVATAVLFGLFHVLTGNALLIERFIPSTLMGLIIGWVAFRSGSVFPGMIVHLVHNGLLNLVMYYADRLNFLGQGFDDQTHLPPTWLAIAGTTAAIGALIVWFATRASVEAKLQLEPTT